MSMGRNLSTLAQEVPSRVQLWCPPQPMSESDHLLLLFQRRYVEMIELTNDGKGLGFGIIGGRSTGVMVKTILPGGAAGQVSSLTWESHEGSPPTKLWVHHLIALLVKVGVSSSPGLQMCNLSHLAAYKPEMRLIKLSR